MPKNSNTVQERINESAALYGNKAANLIELDSLCKKIENKKIYIKIPEIYPIDDQAIQQHLDTYAKDWRTFWEEFAKTQANHKILTNEGKSILALLRNRIFDAFKNYPFFPEVIKKSNCSEDTLFMVRSSGDEDRVEIANPGGNKSVAAVKLDTSSISNAIGTVVASYFSEKSLTQRLLSGDDIQHAFMPVLIQKMIGEKLNGFDNPKQQVISGVMYAKQSGITRLDAAFGHGEIIVNSKAPFDTFEVTDDDIVHAAIHHKKSRLVPTEVKNDNNEVARKLIFKENPKKLQEAPSVTPEVAAEIAHVGRHIANHYGMPMDIEWVFSPETQTLSIVQARPIPQNVKRKITPSTISPDQWKKFKSDPDIQLSKTPVISPAGNEAKIVKPETTIFAGNIATALGMYLKKSEQKHVDAVVVKEPAPSTSHEAAQFNLMGVPVYQGAIESLERWLKEDKAVVVADTQHQHFVNMTNINKKRKIDDEKTLRDEKTIVDGMYASSLSTSKTLLPGYMTENEVIKDKIKQYLSNNRYIDRVYDHVKTNMIYFFLIENIETIESVKINDKNIVAFRALQKIADVFKVMATSTKGHDKGEPHQKLFVHAMLSIAEIDHCLSEFSQLTELNDQQKLKQQELLDLISKLKALVINPGEPNLYSDSIYQLAIQAKTLEESNVDTSKLNSSQRSYFIEFVKLKALALNEGTQRIWEDFSYECARTPVARQMLSQMIMFAVENNMLSELINNLFMNAVKNNTKNETVIAKLYEVFDENRNEFKQYHINENNQLLLAWENRINDWSNPNKFEKLFREFSVEFVPLISSLSLTDGMSNLTQQVILKQVQRLTEVIDKTIKAMKSSMEYQGQEVLLVVRFSRLLVPYHKLMKKWMNVLPDTFYELCAANINDDVYNDKTRMLACIEYGFDDKKEETDPKELNASGYLSVASAKVGSNASFKRQFVNNRGYLTLEDYFSLFHQNILASIAELNKKSMVSCSNLPQVIQPLVTKMLETQNLSLLRVAHNHPMIELEFNLPLVNHSAKFILEFNTKTQSLVLHSKFFGENWSHRMDLIAKMAEIEGSLIGNILQKPTFNEKSLVLEFSWRFNDDQISYLASHIQHIVDHYGLMTNHRRLEELATELRKNLRKVWDRHCVDSCIASDILNYLHFEKRKQIGNEIRAIDKTILVKPFLVNPLEINPFIEGNITVEAKDLYDVLPILKFTTLEKLIDGCGLDVGFFNRKINDSGITQTLLERLISTWNADDALKFLSKYSPSLIEHTSLFKYVKEGNTELFNYLFAHDIPFDYRDFDSTLKNPILKSSVIKELEKWDSAKLSNWMYENSFNSTDDTLTRRCVFQLSDHFGSKIDFSCNPKDIYLTLFERLIQSSCFEYMTENEFNEFLVKHKIDMSKQPDALRLLLLRQRPLGMSLLKKSIEEHILNPNVMHHLREGEIAPLLTGWSAGELKSWMAGNGDKINKTKLNKMMHLYLSKSIHALDPAQPEDSQLKLGNVLSCFKNPKLKTPLIDILKQWDNDSMTAWLIESLNDLTPEHDPNLLEFIELTQANVNKEVPTYNLSLFETIIPWFKIMSKQDIEKFIQHNNVNINNNSTAVLSALVHSCYTLADILIDKGASFKNKSYFDGQSSNKDAQPTLLKAFMKLSKEERSEFLSSYNGVPDFYVQLVESSSKSPLQQGSMFKSNDTSTPKQDVQSAQNYLSNMKN